jgi:hypothetical protein
MARGRGYVQNAAQRLRLAKSRSGGGAGGRGRGGRGRAGASPMPWDSTAQRESAELGAESADARAGLAAGYDRAQRQLGFGVGASDPYSATAQNKTNLESNQRGITNTAGNQLYAGSTANALSGARSSYDQTQKGLEDEFAQAQADFNSGTARTTRDEQLGMAGIKEGALERRVATAPKPLGVGTRRGAARGRGRVTEARGVRRPAAARAMNAQARAINARARRGRGRV